MDGFGERLRKLRKEHDLTQGDLAEHIGVVASAIGKYERVENSYPSVEALIKIADFFNVSIDYLLRGSDSAGVIKNNIRGSLSHSPFIQANNGGVVINGETKHSLSPEVAELIRIYDSLGVRERLKLLNLAFELEERTDSNA